MKIMEMMHQEDGSQLKDKTMEGTILEQSMTTIIYLLAVSLGYAGAGTVSRNIGEAGEFELMKQGKNVKALIVVCQIQHFNEIVLVLKGEVTTFVN